jgi:membrane protease YdiL (CAAX protease family)
LEAGSSNILTDIAYIISPSFANWFVNDSSMVINSMTDYWIVFIMGVFLAPFTEEIIFRNVLFKRLLKKFNIYIGLIVSSMIFSSINFGTQMIGIFMLGIINCMLYVKYENLLMPMLVYFINNIISMIIFILFGEFGNNTIVLTSNDIILYAILGGILFIIGMMFFVKFVNENKVYLRKIYDKNKGVEVN